MLRSKLSRIQEPMLTLKMKPPEQMSLLCLNCRGLGKPRAVTDLRCIFEVCRHSLVFLSETKLSAAEMRDFMVQFEGFTSVYVDYRGRSGGLPMIWKKNPAVNLLSCAANHVDVSVKWNQDSDEWRFTGMYGFPETVNKLKTCELLMDLKHRSTLPWLIGGDLNEILYNFEKRGGHLKSQAV